MSSHLTVPGTFLCLHISISLSFLIDADVNIIDQDKAEHANNPVKTLSETKIILGLDGKVTHRTAPMTHHVR